MQSNSSITARSLRIVVDAMGSDQHPVPDVEGGLDAARETGDTVIFTGDSSRIAAEIAKYGSSDGAKYEVVHADQVVTMEDHPAQVGRDKKDSSMMVGLKLVADGKADAFVSAGNTGAILALSTLYALKRISGVKRPALTSVFNTGKSLVTLVDLGANADSKAEWLVQFGKMGSIYAERVLGLQSPRVALLSNGEEETKGNALIHEAIDLFRQSGLNFTGNVEPKQMLDGAADVVVADGFVGNIALKTMEATGSALFSAIRAEVKGLLPTLGALLLRPALRRIYKTADPFEIGGAPLLGVDGVVIVSHGRSNAEGIKNAVLQARRAVHGGLIEALRAGFSRDTQTDNAK